MNNGKRPDQHSQDDRPLAFTSATALRERGRHLRELANAYHAAHENAMVAGIEAIPEVKSHNPSASIGRIHEAVAAHAQATALEAIIGAAKTALASMRVAHGLDAETAA